MSTNTLITCRLYIPQKYYAKLNDKAKEIFIDDNLGLYYSEFTANVTDKSYLGEFIIAYCEVSLIMNNPAYELTPECDLHCELLKLGHDENHYNLLIDIKYPDIQETFHDILLFKEREQHLGFYSFELLGDQTLFSVE
jgi:hypothetical protein